MGEQKSLQQELKRSFAQIQKKARLLGIKDEQLRQLDTVQKLKRRKNTSVAICASLFVLSLGVAVIYGRSPPEVQIPRKVAEWIAKVLDFDIEKDNCLIPHQEWFLDMFRPPVDCGICRDVDRVDRVQSLSPSDFTKKYAYSARPVVITDGTVGWTAPDIFTFDFFKGIYQPGSPVLEGDNRDCQFFPYQTEFSTLNEVFNMSKQRAQMKEDPWYIGWSNCDSHAANILRQHYQKPYFLPEEAESSKTDWIFMGCPGYGAHLHIDAVGKPSWQAQISGTKKWTIEPPPECYYECKKFEVVVHPGEVIVLDTNKWFHQTDIIGSNLSITIGSEYD